MSAFDTGNRPIPRQPICWLVIGVGLVCALPDLGRAQTMKASPSTYSAGYGASLTALSGAVNTSLKDANGNLIILDGVIKSGNGAHLLGFDPQTGVQTQGAGVGVSGSSASSASASALAIGNNVTVTTTGSNNTVIVNAVQTNTGPVQATVVLNGHLNLSDGG